MSFPLVQLLSLIIYKSAPGLFPALAVLYNLAVAFCFVLFVCPRQLLTRRYEDIKPRTKLLPLREGYLEDQMFTLYGMTANR